MQNVLVMVRGTGVATAAAAAEMTTTTTAALHALVAAVAGGAGFLRTLNARKRAARGSLMIGGGLVIFSRRLLPGRWFRLPARHGRI